MRLGEVEIGLGRLKRLRLLVAVFLIAAVDAAAQVSAASPAAQLVMQVNAHRLEQGLAAIPLSASLTRVAQAHVRDLEASHPAGACNAHSWSDRGDWTPCCYTADHAQAQCMWDKPREITRGAYPGNGFEIAFWTSGRVNPDEAMNRWKASPGHHGVMLNQGVWAGSRWRAIGVAVSAHYAVVWFGEEAE